MLIRKVNLRQKAKNSKLTFVLFCFFAVFFACFLVLNNTLRKVKTSSKARKARAFRTYEKKIIINSGLSTASKRS